MLSLYILYKTSPLQGTWSLITGTAPTEYQETETTTLQSTQHPLHVLAQHQRRCQARGLDAIQAGKPTHTMLLRPLHHEVSCRHARGRQLGPDARICVLQ